MKHLVQLNINELNLVIRGLELIRDSAQGLVMDLVNQVAEQNKPAAPVEETKPAEKQEEPPVSAETTTAEPQQ